MLQTQIAPEVFNLFDGVAMISTVVGLVLSVIAIVLAFTHKRDADKMNRSTELLLVEIRSETKAITTFVMTELQAYGSSMRDTFARNQLTASAPSAVIASEMEFKQPSK